MASFRTALCLILLSLVSRSTQDTFYVPQNATVAATSVTPCHMYGDSDLYGLGIRLSLYLQFFAAVIARICRLDKEISNLRTTFNIVILALLINGIISTLHGTLTVLEWYIVGSLALVMPLTVISPSTYYLVSYKDWLNQRLAQRTYLNKDKRRSRKEASEKTLKGLFQEIHQHPFGIAFLYIFEGVSFAMQPWIYWTMEDQGKRSGCTPRVYAIFMSISLNNPHWRRFLKVGAVFSVFVAIYYLSSGMLFLSYGIYKKRNSHVCVCKQPCGCCLECPDTRQTGFKLPKEEDEGQGNEESATPAADTINCECPDECPCCQQLERREQYEEDAKIQHKKEEYLGNPENRKHYEAIVKEHGQDPFSLRLKWNVQRAMVILWYAFVSCAGVITIAFIEKTITINNIDMSDAPIYSAGQLIPLIVGAVTFISTTWVAFWERKDSVWGEIKRLNKARKNQAERLAEKFAQLQMPQFQMPEFSRYTPSSLGRRRDVKETGRTEHSEV